jgi:hypothetical protein
MQSGNGVSKPDGTGGLPKGIVEDTSDLFFRALGADPAVEVYYSPQYISCYHVFTHANMHLNGYGAPCDGGGDDDDDEPDVFLCLASALCL